MKISEGISNDELKVFVEEAEEHIIRLNRNVAKLRDNGNNSELIQDIFRSVHTLKGSSAILGHTRMIQITHAMESLLDKLRYQKLQINKEIVDTLLQAISALTTLKDEITCEEEKSLDIHSVVNRLKATEDKIIYNQKTDAVLNSAQIKPDHHEYHDESSRIHNDVYQESSLPLETKSVEYTGECIQHVRLDTRTLDKITTLTSDLFLDCLQINKISKMLGIKYGDDDRTHNLNLISRNLTKSMKEIYEDIMTLRMVPVDILFHIFPRMVEDLSRTQGKKIDFSIEGEGIRLDRIILSQIRDPLIHLLRNAVDHGIESPEYRLKTGKSETGKVHLAVKQENDCVIIILEDDGKGINPFKIKDSAISRGCISSKLADELSKEELIDLIFLPGMSTTDQATEVSGRGIGLDIVRSNVEQLNGMVSINTRVGQGTVFTIQLPPTAAFLQGFMVTSNNSNYIIPQIPVIETLRIRTRDIKSIRSQDFIKINQQKIPIFHINNLNGGTQTGRSTRQEQMHIIIVRVGATVAGIASDEVMTQQKFIISPKSAELDDTTDEVATTILEDGQAAMIVNIPSFIRTSLLQRIEIHKIRH